MFLSKKMKYRKEARRDDGTMIKAIELSHLDLSDNIIAEEGGFAIAKML